MFYWLSKPKSTVWFKPSCLEANLLLSGVGAVVFINLRELCIKELQIGLNGV